MLFGLYVIHYMGISCVFLQTVLIHANDNLLNVDTVSVDEHGSVHAMSCSRCRR